MHEAPPKERVAKNAFLIPFWQEAVKLEGEVSAQGTKKRHDNEIWSFFRHDQNINDKVMIDQVMYAYVRLIRTACSSHCIAWHIK